MVQNPWRATLALQVSGAGSIVYAMQRSMVL